jgi:GlpG protein
MRQAGTIATRQDAQRFANYLLTLGIGTKVDGAGDAWGIWILDENQVPRARQELDQFEREPQDARYRDAEHAAKIARREASEKLRKARKNHIDMRNEWAKPWRRRPVTIALIAVSVAVFLGVLDAFGIGDRWLYFSEVPAGAPEITHGQVWRIVTPIIMHGSILHLLFNMWWLYDLGTLIERGIGSLRYLLLVLIVAAISNSTQFVAQGPFFVGMSGVVYGLFGYSWIQSRYTSKGYVVTDQDTMWLMGWFVLCATGLVGYIANAQHALGLTFGLLAGMPAYVAFRRSSARPAFEEGSWADLNIRGFQRFKRLYYDPYVPLWFVALAVVVTFVG